VKATRNAVFEDPYVLEKGRRGIRVLKLVLFLFTWRVRMVSTTSSVPAHWPCLTLLRSALLRMC